MSGGYLYTLGSQHAVTIKVRSYSHSSLIG